MAFGGYVANEAISGGTTWRRAVIYVTDPPQATPTGARTAPAVSPGEGSLERSAQAARSGPDDACRPAGRPVVVRPVDPRVAEAVDVQWRRIERWLKANAPVTYARLRAPARARTIAIAESQTGVPFPDSLRASLLRHNGAHPAEKVLPGLRAYGVREIRDTWRALCAAHGPSVDGRTIPFAASARWTSYYALLRATAGSLETGRPVRGLRPEVISGRLHWTEPDPPSGTRT